MRNIRHQRLAPWKQGIPLDLNETTFTPSMAKRDGPGPWAAAPIAQGDWDGVGGSDVLSFPRGANIAGHWYGNFDPYQGGGFVNFLPEQSSGDRAGLAYIWYVSVAYNLAYDYTNERYSLTIGTQTMTLAQAIVAGTVEYLAWGYDTKNTLDGTFYAYISRNDAQTFGINVQPTVSAPAAVTSIGGGGFFPANAIIAGLLFVRIVPWTGAFGVDLGLGDIVAIHAAGADIAETIGAWDSTFSLPTDSAVGPLVTGAGEAWSMRHASNVIPAADGFMTAAAWANWVMVGTPINSAVLANAEKIFEWGYKFDADAANEGYYYQRAGLAAGSNYVVRVTLHEGGGAQARIRIWDVTNAQQMLNTVDFDSAGGHTRTAPWSETFAFELATIARSGAVADCTSFQIQILEITGGGAGTTVYVHQAEIYDNLVDNPSMETGAGNPWIPDGWANNGLAAGDGVQEGAIIHSGASSFKVDMPPTPGGIRYDWPATVGNFYAAGVWSYFSAGIPNIESSLAYRQSVDAVWNQNVTGAAWSHYATVLRVLNVASRLGCRGSNVIAVGYFDDAYMIALDPVALTVTPASEANSAESGGLRVDGYDLLTQPVNNRLRARSGLLTWRWRPRHNPANLVAFDDGVANPINVYAWGDATNYFTVWAIAANTLQVQFDAAGGGPWNANWACAGAWVEDQELFCELEYTGAFMQFRVDGVPVATVANAVDFAVVPTIIYWGLLQAGGREIDAVYKEP